MAVKNINRLQKKNSDKVFSFIDQLTTDSPEARGELLPVTSPIEGILYDWADGVIKDLRASWLEHGFNEASQNGLFEPLVIDKAGLIKVLQMSPANDNDAWYWAEKGRGPTRKKGAVPLWKILENWITYRGIDVHTVKQWQTKREGKMVKPYKNLTSTLKMRRVMAEAFARSIHKKGTIKRFGYKGSKWFSSVVNSTRLNELSAQISEELGYQVSISLTSQF